MFLQRCLMSPCSYEEDEEEETEEEEKKLKETGRHEIDGSSGSSDVTQELVKKRLSGFRKWDSALETTRGSTKEEWLSLSIPGSSSSSYQKPEKSRAPAKITEALSIGIGSSLRSTSPVNKNRKLSTLKNSKVSDISQGPCRNSNLHNTDSLSLREEERGERKRKNSEKHEDERRASNNSASVESFPHFKKRKLGQMTSGESRESSSKSWITLSLFSHKKENEQEEDRQRMAESGWVLETAFRMGVSHPEFCLNKRVTKTDTERNQNRFQLTQTDITKSSPCLQKLAEKAKDMPSPNGVPVKVMDRAGRTYGMTFKYLDSSHTYRFMGAGYAEFLRTTGLTENQSIDIWSLPRYRRRNEGDHWLAFIQ